MKAILTGILIFSFALVSCQENEQKAAENPSIPVLKLDSLIISENEANRFHGTVVIGNRDSMIYHKAIGIADRVWDIPIRLDHRFDIASLNKSFFAVLILIAVEEGKLDLNDKLKDLLKNYQYSGKFDAQITVHQMLTHTSGLPDYGAVNSELSENNFLNFKRKRFSNTEYIDFISRLNPAGLPGEQFYYSNFAYHLLAIILEDIYQKTFPEILQEKICQPLNLTETFATTSNEEVHKKVVEAYNYSTADGQWKRNNFIDLSLGRRIFSSAPDLYKWGAAMHKESLLSKKSLKLIQTNHLSNLSPEMSYGYGWVVFDGKSQYKIGSLSIEKKYIIHGGATEGYKAMLVIIERGEYIITLLSNVGSQTNEMTLTQKIVHILTNADDEN